MKWTAPQTDQGTKSLNNLTIITHLNNPTTQFFDKIREAEMELKPRIIVIMILHTDLERIVTPFKPKFTCLKIRRI